MATDNPTIPQYQFDHQLLASANKDNKLAQFNAQFVNAKRDQQIKEMEREKYITSNMNNIIVEKPLSQSTIGDLLVGIKNSWFGIMDDLLQKKYTVETFTKNRRLFYTGITIILFALFLFLCSYFDEN